MNASGALRPVGLLLREFAKIFGLGGRVSGRAAKAATKAGAGEAARQLSAAVPPLDVFGDDSADTTPQGFETFLFKQLRRPRLTERSASDLTIEDAQDYAKQASRFYGFNFPLFARDDFFYEEVEQEFLRNALGHDEDSIDTRFIEVMTLFRRTLNDNTRTMLVFWAPLFFVSSLVFGLYLSTTLFGNEVLAAIGMSGASSEDGYFSIILFAAGGLLLGLFLTFLFFSWPYKVVQQRNLMNLDNYLTSKFARINHNFQVAKRRALNVERDKRMGQREELKDDAGAWTLSYHWFAMRLFLCELTIRNKFYQIRRNTTLYWAASIGLCSIGLLMVLGVGSMANVPIKLLGIVGAIGSISILLTGLVLRRVSAMTFRVIEANEWSRFHMVSLQNTIADHVGEDKVQIVTFRDRNRFE